MPLNPNEHWQCQTCFHYFPSDKELREHIEAFQSRARHLFDELQKCFAHFDPKLSDEEDCGAPDDDRTNGLVNDDDDGREKLLCPHLECEGKPRTIFKKWKNFVRHYTIHVQCHEICVFCGHDIYRVRKYVTHFDNCKARKGQGKVGRSKENAAIERRTALCKMASDELRRICRIVSDELELEMSTIANTSDEEVSSQGISSSCYGGVSRKRAREKADSDPENLHQPRKRRIAKEDNVDATVAIRSDSSYQAPGTTDVAREIATPANFEMSSNDTLILTHHTAGASLPSHCDMDRSTTLSGNDGSFSAGGTDFLQYSLGALARAPLLFSHTMDGSASYTGHEYEPATHARAPLLCSHTMDGSSSLSAGHQYEATVLARAPLLASHTMDGSSSLSAGHQYEATVLARAPLLASHTMDGSSSYQTVCPYEASAQARIPSVEYKTVDRRQSDTQLTNEEIIALYSTQQANQILVPGAGGYR